jgi:phosphoadenosine phosphosulfate reductase
MDTAAISGVIHHQTPLQLPLSSEDLVAINAYLSTLPPQEILRWAITHLPNLAQTTAFGLTGLVALDMISNLVESPRDRPPVIFLDTLYHFPETYELVGEVKMRYGVEVHVFKPYSCDTVENFEQMFGQKFWETDESSYDYLVKVCRQIRLLYDCYSDHVL